MNGSCNTFSSMYCGMNKIPIPSFEEHLLVRTCHKRSKALYLLAIRFGASTLEREKDLLQVLGQASSLEKIEAMINGVYFSSYLRDIGRFRRRMGMRISGSKLIHIAQESFEQSIATEAPS
jgi:hypothetical protein